MSKRVALGSAVAAVAAVAVAASLAAAAVPGAAAPVHSPAARARGALAAPRVQIMVIGRTRTLLRPRRIKAAAGAVTIGRRRCAVPAGTALAGLLASRLPVRVTDQSGCDPPSMFVTRIRGVVNSGQGGWEYKVGHADPSFGAADPGGRLRAAQQLLWYWCVRANECQRTLSVISAFMGSSLQVHVFGYDQNGHRQSIGGASVHYGTQTQPTDSGGHAAFALTHGVREVYATKPGLVRSFPTEVGVVS
jgi:hypothetical protein